MKKLSKHIAAGLLVCMILTVLPAPTALAWDSTAAVPVVEDAPFVEMLTCDGWEAGATIGSGNDYGDAPNDMFKLNVVEENGERGNALRWSTLSLNDYWGQQTALHLAADSNLTDWTNYKELWCYVDISSSTKTDPVFRMSTNNGGSGWTHLIPEAPVYFFNSETRMETESKIGTWNEIFLPAQFKGWVRIPFSSLCVNGDYIWKAVHNISVGFTLNTGETAIIDSFCALTQDWNAETNGLPCDRHMPEPELLPEQVTLVWDMETLPTGVYYGEAGDSSGISAAHPTVGTSFRVSAANKAGFSGSRALAWKTLDTSWKAPFYLNLDRFPEAQRDWSNAEELWFWVNAKQWDKISVLDINFTDAQGYTWQTNRQDCTTGTYYIQNEGKWVIRGLNNWGHVVLPAGYMGWVRVSLDASTFSGGSGVKMSLNGVRQVGFYVETGCVDKTVYIDNIGIGRNYTAVSNPVFNEKVLLNPTMSVYKNSKANVLDCSATDLAGDSLNYAVTTQATHGKVIISSVSGKLSYRPWSNYSGTDSFTITVQNANFGKTSLRISVTVLPQADPQPDTTQDLPAANPEWPEQPAQEVLPDPVQERALPLTADLNLEGYVAQNVDGHIDEWLLTALEKNPNIMEQIANASTEKTQLSSILLDYGSAVSSGALAYAIAEGKGWQGNSALQITQLKDNVKIEDTCFAIPGVRDAKTDWSGASQWWIHVDAAEYDTVGAVVGLALQENDPNGPDAYGLQPDMPFYTCSDGSDVWQTGTTISTAGSGANTGALQLPAGFSGWLRIPFTTLSKLYWAGGGNRVMELSNVVQLNLRLEAAAGMNGKSIYYSEMGVSASGEATALPIGADGADEGFRTVWSMNTLTSAKGSYAGALVPWYGEFVGKLLTGVGYCYQTSPSAELKTAGDEIVAKLAEAQGADGYLGIYSGAARMGGNGTNWDVWNHYHAIYGLLEWYRLTGSEEARDVARKATAFVYSYFSASELDINAAGSQTMNLAICHAFALMYQDTGKEEYLTAAKQIVDTEWPKSGNWMNEALQGVPYYQSTLPRWEALHAISCLGTLYEITGETKYYTALENIYWSIAETDRHNTGGFTAGEQAVGDPYASGSIETCCAVAWTALGTEYLQLSKNSLVADELELTYFNNILASLLDDNRTSTYDTPMNGYLLGFTRFMDFQWNEGSPDFNCCQANIGRGVGSVSQWAVLTDSEALYLNYYGASTIKAQTPSGGNVTLQQQTEYPVNGEINLTIGGLEEEESFTLRLRIPAWATGSEVRVDGQVLRPEAGKYLSLDRVWKNGDFVRITLNVDFHYWVGDKSCAGKTAVYYGPVLLVLEKSTYNGIDSMDNIVLQTTDLQNAVVTSGAEIGTWLRVGTLDINDIPVCLTDLASVRESWLSGVDYAYMSWLNLHHRMNYQWFVKGGKPVWCNTDGCSHRIIDEDDAVSATCTEAGLTKGSHCAVCGEILTVQQQVAALEHDFITHEAKAATCTEAGWSAYNTCSRCDYTDYQELAPLGHDWDEGKITAEPTETEAGLRTFTCSRCDAVRSEAVSPTGVIVLPFTDVAKNKWYYEAVKYVYKNGLFSGVSDTHFKPDGNMSRAMLVSVLWRMEDEPEAEADNPFVDVAAGRWYTQAVLWASQNDIVAGKGNGSFDPDGNVTREQIAAVLYRYVQAKDGDITDRAELSTFSDSDKVSSWAKDAMSWAYAKGFISGEGTGQTVILNPKGNASRAQVASLLMRFDKSTK